MKKKLLALALALGMLLSLAACGAEKTPTGTVEPLESSAPTADTGDTPTADVPSDEPTAPADDGPDYEFGSMTGGVYKNDFLGIGCTLDESWTYYSDEEIANLNGLVIDSMDDEEIAETLRSSSVIYDMYAMAESGLVTMNIVFENLGVLYGTALDTAGYVDIAISNLGDALTSAGYSDVNCEKTTVDFCGETCDAIDITGVLSEMTVYEKLICMKRGNYIAVITLASFGEDVTADLAALFYSL